MCGIKTVLIILGLIVAQCCCLILPITYKKLKCDNTTCQDGGVCSEDLKAEYGIKCSCFLGFKGTFCEIDTSICSETPCLNGGMCTALGGPKYWCKCAAGFAGNRCEIKDVCGTKEDPCKNGGRCKTQVNGNIVCRCNSFFKGKFCEQNVYSCPKMKWKSREFCRNNGECFIKKSGKKSCRCDIGWYGQYCQDEDKCHNIDPTFCQNGGTCINDITIGTIKCQCKPGFKGRQCKIRINTDNILIKTISNKELNKINKINVNSLKLCGVGCEPSMLSNGKCDNKCNIRACNYDNGDCNPWNSCYIDNLVLQNWCRQSFNNGICNPECNNVNCLFDGQDCAKLICDKRSKCDILFQNGECNEECNNPQCGFDGGDCNKKSSKSKIDEEEKTNTESFFNMMSTSNCNMESNNGDFKRKEFLLKLTLQTNMKEFKKLQTKFLQKLSSELHLVLRIVDINQVEINGTQGLVIQLSVSPLECIVYGGQCFSSMKQISKFLQATIKGKKPIALPFRVASFQTSAKLINPKPSKKFNKSTIIIIFMATGFCLMMVITGVLIRDKFGRLRTQIRTAGIWTPSQGYCTSTSSVCSNNNNNNSNKYNNNGHKSFYNMDMNDHKNSFKNLYCPSNSESKLDTQFTFSSFKKDNYLPRESFTNWDSNNDSNNKDIMSKRKRKYELIDASDKASSFQLIVDALQSKDGVHSTGAADSCDNQIIQIINSCADNKSPLADENNNKISGSGNRKHHHQFTNIHGISNNDSLGRYANDNGESLLHIAARMNCSNAIIKRLHNLSSNMLHTVDKWGRTPLETAVSCDAIEAAEMLLSLEKQSRKEMKQKNKLKNNNNNNMIFPTESNPQITNKENNINNNILTKKTTALIEAVKIDSREILNLLLDESVPLNVLDSLGRSVVHWAAMYNNVELLQRISQMKVFNKLVELKDLEEKSPLYLAASEGCTESVKFLGDYIIGANLKLEPHCPCPLQIALELGHEDTVEVLKELNIVTFELTVSDVNDLNRSSSTSNSINNDSNLGGEGILKRKNGMKRNKPMNKDNFKLAKHSNNYKFGYTPDLGVIKEDDFMFSSGYHLNKDATDSFSIDLDERLPHFHGNYIVEEDDVNHEEEEEEEDNLEEMKRLRGGSNIWNMNTSIDYLIFNDYQFDKPRMEDQRISPNSPNNQLGINFQRDQLHGYQSTNSSSDLSPSFPSLPTINNNNNNNKKNNKNNNTNNNINNHNNDSNSNNTGYNINNINNNFNPNLAALSNNSIHNHSRTPSSDHLDQHNLQSPLLNPNNSHPHHQIQSHHQHPHHHQPLIFSHNYPYLSNQVFANNNYQNSHYPANQNEDHMFHSNFPPNDNITNLYSLFNDTSVNPNSSHLKQRCLSLTNLPSLNINSL